MSNNATNPLKVLFVSHSGAMGGAERCLLSLVRGLDRSRFSPIVVVPRHGTLVCELQNCGVSVRQSPLRLWTGFNSNTPAEIHLFRNDFSGRVSRLAKLIDDEKADVVVSNSVVFLEGAFAARRAGRPHVWNVLEILSKDPGLIPFLPLNLVYSWMPRITNAIVAVSAAVAEEFQGYLPTEMIRTIHTGIQKPAVSESSADVRTELGFSPDTSIVLFVGLLSERKGVRTLAAAIPHIMKSFPQTQFLFAGADGGMKGFLQAEIHRLGLESSVKLLGQRTDVGRLVSECTVFVLPANADPLPVAVLEAMALGKPVVATRSGGCSEMVEHETTGLLVEPQSPTDLASAINQLLADVGLANDMGNRGLERFQKMFSREQYVRSFQSLIEEVGNTTPHSRDLENLAPELPDFPPFDVTLKTRCQAILLRSREGARVVRDVLRSRFKSVWSARRAADDWRRHSRTDVK